LFTINLIKSLFVNNTYVMFMVDLETMINKWVSETLFR